MGLVIFKISILLYIVSSAVYILYVFLQKKAMHRIAHTLLWLGFCNHTLFIVSDYAELGQMPVQTLHGTLSIFAWAIAFIFLVFHIRFKLMVLGAFVGPLITFLSIVSYALPGKPATVSPLFKSLWLTVHIITSFVGNAAFAIACVVGILYLIQEGEIKEKRQGFFYRRLPSLKLLDSMGYACIIVGFPMLTAGILTGSIYSQLVWGRYWSWDPKEVWSGITWILYAILLHERLTVGWQGRRAAVMSILGFSVLLFTFFGVNFLLKGHHAVFTKW
nr:c-type cytochrome biogenesis protein CcsB [Desulfobacterales bacterium]